MLLVYDVICHTSQCPDADQLRDLKDIFYLAKNPSNNSQYISLLWNLPPNLKEVALMETLTTS